ncbi:MAG TPA: NAD-binding protein [Leptolyngbyaceae cyanobacterium M65_K2018_010]|nr:NAD-binding protein [Leptolyngbyaceae cyanobacterium M65_K2018_010]
MAQLGDPSPPPPVQEDGFLVCGLGSLGQHCVANLKTFGVPVYAVNQTLPDQWEVPHLQDLIDHLVVGDCRLSEVLEAARVRHCRAVLLVTQNERVNLEAALTARVLNPRVQLVLRSDQQNLNELLEQQLENFVAFEPTQLAAPAFALEAFSESLLGYFTLDGHRFQVVKQRLEPGHTWSDRRQLYELDTSYRRLLCHRPEQPLEPDQARTAHASSPSSLFYNWMPETRLRVGDEVVVVESDAPRPSSPSLGAATAQAAPKPYRHPLRTARHWVNRLRHWPTLKQDLIRFWQAGAENQIRQVAIICGVTVVVLLIVGTVLLEVNSPEEISIFEAFLFTFITLFGGYGDVFEALADFNRPRLLQLFGIILTVAGAAFIGVLYALLTEKLLTLRFEFMERRPPVPEKDHVVVIWLGRVGRRVLSLLQDLKQPVVGISTQAAEADLLPKIPLLTGDIASCLDRANLTTAKSVVAVSDDEIQNLEMGLMAHRLNPQCRAIIRTYDQQFTDRLAKIFPFAQVICASAISAEAFAGAAFGEDVLALFRLYNQTVLVTQYTIEAEDTLNGLMLSEIAYGYGVVPIWHQRLQQAGKVMPSEDIWVQPGDRLVVLATISGLRRIERRQLAAQTWQVHVDRALTADALFEGAAEIARISGYKLGAAREFLARLPNTLPQAMYRHQALRLVRLLSRAQVKARVIDPVEPDA